MNRLTIEKRAQIVNALVEGNSIRATCRLTGACKDAVLKLVRDMGAACAAFHNAAVRGVKVQRVQCDEVWSFCYAKEKNVPEEKKGRALGSVWTWTAIDADSKLILSYLCGGTGCSWACQVHGGFSIACDHAHSDHNGRPPRLRGSRRRCLRNGRGLRDADKAVRRTFGSVPRRATALPSASAFARAYSAAIPDPQHISTSYVERQNLNLRMGVRRFTRLTNAFSKKFENHCHMVAIYHAYYNFCRVHQTLRVTPAMEAGLTDHVWSLEELVGLLEVKATQAAA